MRCSKPATALRQEFRRAVRSCRGSASGLIKCPFKLVKSRQCLLVHERKHLGHKKSSDARSWVDPEERVEESSPAEATGRTDSRGNLFKETDPTGRPAGSLA